MRGIKAKSARRAFPTLQRGGRGGGQGSSSHLVVERRRDGQGSSSHLVVERPSGAQGLSNHLDGDRLCPARRLLSTARGLPPRLLNGVARSREGELLFDPARLEPRPRKTTKGHSGIEVDIQSPFVRGANDDPGGRVRPFADEVDRQCRPADPIPSADPGTGCAGATTPNPSAGPATGCAGATPPNPSADLATGCAGPTPPNPSAGLATGCAGATPPKPPAGPATGCARPPPPNPSAGPATGCAGPTPPNPPFERRGKLPMLAGMTRGAAARFSSHKCKPSALFARCRAQSLQ
jgi:hypothetical protein